MVGPGPLVVNSCFKGMFKTFQVELLLRVSRHLEKYFLCNLLPPFHVCSLATAMA